MCEHVYLPGYPHCTDADCIIACHPLPSAAGLPTEVITAIAEHLSKDTLKMLSRASTGVRQTVIPLLFPILTFNISGRGLLTRLMECLGQMRPSTLALISQVALVLKYQEATAHSTSCYFSVNQEGLCMLSNALHLLHNLKTINITIDMAEYGGVSSCIRNALTSNIWKTIEKSLAPALQASRVQARLVINICGLEQYPLRIVWGDLNNFLKCFQYGVPLSLCVKTGFISLGSAVTSDPVLTEQLFSLDSFSIQELRFTAAILASAWVPIKKLHLSDLGASSVLPEVVPQEFPHLQSLSVEAKHIRKFVAPNLRQLHLRGISDGNVAEVELVLKDTLTKCKQLLAVELDIFSSPSNLARTTSLLHQIHATLQDRKVILRLDLEVTEAGDNSNSNIHTRLLPHHLQILWSPLAKCIKSLKIHIGKKEEDPLDHPPLMLLPSLESLNFIVDPTDVCVRRLTWYLQGLRCPNMQDISLKLASPPFIFTMLSSYLLFTPANCSWHVICARRIVDGMYYYRPVEIAPSAESQAFQNRCAKLGIKCSVAYVAS
jgi:hypothetical protein